jgi:carbamoyl-phosphate synthase large subunit
MIEPIRLLITSVGSLVATNLFESLAALGRDRFFVAGTNTVAEAAGNYACDTVLRVPPTEDRAAWWQALAQWGDEVQPDLWIPTRDDDVCALAQLATEVPLHGKVLVGTPAVAEIIADKWLSYTFAVQHGLPVAPSAKDMAGALTLATQYGFPLIVKPRQGYGTRGTRLVFDAGQLLRRLETGAWVVQPFLAPEPGWQKDIPDPALGMPLWYSYQDPGQYSVVAQIKPDGGVEVIGATLNTMVCGRPERSVREDDPRLAQVGADYARALAAAGWRGPVNVQCRRLSDGRYVMFELAGRLAGGLGGREAVGIPEVWQVLQAWLPGRMPPLPPTGGQAGSVACKTVQTIALLEADLRIFESTGRWRAYS